MSFNLFATLLILVLLSYIAASQSFTSSLTISNDPSQGLGSSVTVNPLYYDVLNQQIRLDYPNLRDPTSGKRGFQEIYNFKTQTLFQLCNVCSVYTNPLPFPIYYKEATDQRAPVQSNRLSFNLNGKTCDAYQKINAVTGGTLYIWVTADGITCRAERTDGTIYNFNNFQAGTPDSSLFKIPESANCPKQQKCGSPFDLVLVLDESGSIHREEWAQLITFATGVVNSFIVGPNNTQIGLVFFSGVQYATGEDPASCCGLSDPALPLSFDGDTINKFLLNHQQTGGHTCINCGIKSATTYEPNRNRPIQVPKVMLVLSDGFNNRMTDFFAIDIQNAKDAGWNMFAIGVANASEAELNQIASSRDQVFKIDNFGALETIAKTVINRLCGAFPTLTPCGPICKGKCGCGGNCICPDTCVNPDKCAQGSCVNGVAGSSCLYTQTFCDPFATNGSLCLQNICDKTNGKCGVITKNCTLIQPDTCYTQKCDPKIGCTLIDSCPIPNQPGTNTPSVCFTRSCVKGVCSVIPKNCTDGNLCATTSCDPALGCVSSPINCDDGNACTVDTCDKNVGCIHKAIQCPSNEFLNSTTFKNNPCLIFKCDPKVGCTSTPKTCDDGNICTTDSCFQFNAACINAPVTCPTNATNKCQIASCDRVAGCTLTNKNCDDGNFCTIDSCNPSTGTCINTPIVCPASSDSCFTNECDPGARKCVNKPKIICPTNSTNKCLRSTCAAGKCEPNAAFICPVIDLCSLSTCDPDKGCSYQPKICNDNNNCTVDSCEAGVCVFKTIDGCKNTTVCPNCVSDDPCVIAKCQNGTCIKTPFTCPINRCGTVTPTKFNNTCQCVLTQPVQCSTNASVCGTPACDPTTGLCSFVNNRVCNDNDPCTNDICTIVQGKAVCSFTQITCPGDSPCSRKKCAVVSGALTCIDNPIANTLNCTSTFCANATCNFATGLCQFTSNPCNNPSDSTCSREVCDPVKQQCVGTAGLTCPAIDPSGCGQAGVCVFKNNVETCKYNNNCTQSDNGCIISTCKVLSNGTFCQSSTFNCDDNNVCTNDQCLPDGVDDNGNPKSKCVNTPVVCTASTDPCSLNLCVNVNGKPTCQSTAVVCNTTSKCITGKCFVEKGNGVCKYNETNCGAPDNCTNFVCDPANGCKKINKCDDGNPCTNDLCDLKTGKCTFTQKQCNSTNICQKGVCDPNVGCVLQPIDCIKDKNVTALDICHFAVCQNTTGCVLAVIPNSLDACGFCNQPGKCNKTPANRSSGIPAGAIAGAVIGGAVVAGIVALGIGLFAASSGAAAFTPGTQVQMVGGSNNPLYTDGDTGGTNPFEDNDYVPL
eukprot:TRINITY_DN2637_c0_g2_i1.p1 TRINITY_DN2637_c0_g2~~TRINITY_DN2637_c0_g2_i1.p1  ORF type:complete len:1325 (+),score=322.31 TRINITY_DN2637_c0_g2_i1:52-4026(+)